MSKFTQFMKANKIEKPNEEYAPTATLCDTDGKPLKWEFKHISSERAEQLRAQCTTEVQVTGKPNLFRPKLNSDLYMKMVIVESVVYPDLRDAELQDSYGVKKPEELLQAMVDDMGEYQSLLLWIQEFQGLTKTFEEKVDDAKN